MPGPSSSGTTPFSTGRRPSNQGTRLERIPVLIFDDTNQLAYQVARRIATLVESKQAIGEYAVLGLPTGSTPIGVYQHLIDMHRNQGLDFSNVITFNLDEYYPMRPDNLQSYHRFMRENFFDFVNIPDDHIHIPDGTIPREEIEEHCLEYEYLIEKAGGIDLLLLGIGRSGHIGFNEPGSGPTTRTRLIVLDQITRKDAASDFFAEENVPREALTMGVGTILAAREVILMATGEHKAPIIRRTVEEEPTRQVTASFLQEHNDAEIFVDRAAAGALTREETPWLVKEVDWSDEALSKRAVIWLSQKLQKPILHLEAADFYQNHLHDLLHSHDTVDDLCFKIFDDLRRRIQYRSDLPKHERVIVFSPHPDDDVISMGGMLDKLVQNENDVIVAYMTNGSVAVFDDDVIRHLQFYSMSNPVLEAEGDPNAEARSKKFERIYKFLAKKKPGEIDTNEVQQIKAYIRYTEAIAGLRVLNLGTEQARFLDMPFYKTGRVRKDPIGKKDIEIVLDLLQERTPHHIFVAGDLSDPHGTHRMCYKAIKEALELYNKPAKPTRRKKGEEGAAEANGQPSSKRPHPLVWLYRGAWQEWEIDKADVFIPLSKADLNRKIDAIYKHESQKDRALFPGAYDEREFWERARDRNGATADALDELGLPAFHAAEAYVTAHDMP